MDSFSLQNRSKTFRNFPFKMLKNSPKLSTMKTTIVLKGSISIKLHKTFKQQTLNYIQKSSNLQNGLINDL